MTATVVLVTLLLAPAASSGAAPPAACEVFTRSSGTLPPLVREWFGQRSERSSRLGRVRHDLLDQLELSPRFAAICGADTFGVSKPDPAILRQTIARAGGNPSSTIMVGDAGTDIGVARRTGVPVIGVTFGYTDVPIADLEPDRLIDHMRELPGAVDDLLLRPSSI